MCRVLDETEFASFLQGAKVRALRWDLVAWGLVIDLDSFMGNERDMAEVHRGWLVFEGIQSIEFPHDAAILPNGLVLTDGERNTDVVKMIAVYTLVDGSTGTGALIVRANKTYAVCSEETFKDDYPSSITNRLAAGPDAEMKAVLN